MQQMVGQLGIFTPSLTLPFSPYSAYAQAVSITGGQGGEAALLAVGQLHTWAGRLLTGPCNCASFLAPGVCSSFSVGSAACVLFPPGRGDRRELGPPYSEAGFL